jgi:DNA-binding response OmpR family regulator
MMPGDINGLALCREVRRTELLSHIPIIIVTAKTTEKDRVEGLKAGADAYLVKPFNSEELLVRVHKLLERQRQMRQKYAELGRISDDDMPQDELSAVDRQFMNRLVDVVYQHMVKGSLDMQTLADEMKVSRTQLNRKVMAITGLNASTYVMKLRMSRARRLLKADITMSIGDVAQKCGFEDMAYFSRLFKQMYQETPSQYRKKT